MTLGRPISPEKRIEVLLLGILTNADPSLWPLGESLALNPSPRLTSCS